MKNQIKSRLIKSALMLIFYFLFTQFSIAQEIKLYVKKGKVKVSEQILKAGDIHILLTSDVLKVEDAGLALLQRENAFVEVPQNQTFNYKELKKLIPQKKSYNQAFVHAATSQEYSKKRSAGAVTRGGQDDKESFSPADNFIVLSDSIQLRVGGPEVKLLTDIKLFEKSNKDTITLSSLSNTHNLPCPEPGDYYWEYMFNRRGDKYIANNYFIVPDSEVRDSLITSFNEYKKNLDGFSDEMRSALIEEYCYIHKLYFYPVEENNTNTTVADIHATMASINERFIEQLDKPKATTRGSSANPCEKDLVRLKVVFKEWENYYKKCCAGKPNAAELANILHQVAQILKNGACKWEDNSEMYLVVLIYFADLSSRMENYPCARKCSCGGCE